MNIEILGEFGHQMIVQYKNKAVELGVMTEADHVSVMNSLRKQVMEEYKRQTQEHLDQHAEAGDDCEALNDLLKHFVITRTLSGGYTVEGFTKVFEENMLEQGDALKQL